MTLGLALSVVTTSAVRAADVDDLDDIEPTVVFTALCEHGLCPVQTFDMHGGGDDLLDATFRASIDFDAKNGGQREVIFETGAGTIGWSLVYEAPSTLVARATGANGSLALVRYVLPQHLIDSGEVVVAWSYDVEDEGGTQTIGITLNDFTVASVAGDLGGDWSGVNAAAFGRASPNMAGRGEGLALAGVDFTSGVIDVDSDLLVGLEFFADTRFVPPTSDSDGDLLADEWELLFSNRLDLLGGGDVDADGDGLSDARELEASSDPTASDTDGDGLSDGEEISEGTDLSFHDTDLDGVDDGDEVHGEPATDPLDPDTDGDLFTDGAERDCGSDPTDSESFCEAICDGVDELDVGDITENVTFIGTIPSLNNHGGGNDLLDATFRVYIDFEPKTDCGREVIFETGAGTNGFSLVYESGNILVLRASGKGRFIGARCVLPDRLLQSEDPVEVAWTFDVDDGRGQQGIRLLLNRAPVARASGDLGADWTGANDASFGAASSSVGGFGPGSSGFASGSIDLDRGLEFHANTLLCPDTTDIDEDGLPDRWEELHAPDLAALAGGEGDADGDGLTDVDELALGTDPTVSDSDGDGLVDGREEELGTDPLYPDSDRDGRPDGSEVDGDPVTDPLDPDSDGDNVDDAFEVARGTDPNDAERFPPPICDGVDALDPPTEVITTIGGPLPSFDNHGGGNDRLDATFRAFIAFEPKTGGGREVIFETGAGTRGFSLTYEVPGALVLRASGNGGCSVATARYPLPDTLIGSGEVEVVWTYDVDNGEGGQTIAIIVNNDLVAHDEEDLGGDWTGDNETTIGVASPRLAAAGDNTDLSGIDFTSGSIRVDTNPDNLQGVEFFADTLLCPVPASPEFRRGDTDVSGVVDISDPIFNLTFQFVGGIGDLPCEDAADVDDSSVVDISDPIYNLTFQFVGGIPPPPLPGDKACGPDPTADPLGCEAYPDEKCPADG